MKISINGDIDQSKGGRQGFLSMLSDVLVKSHGFKLVGKKDKSDINLNSISGSTKKGSINILRIDGIYYDKERIGKNKEIVKSAKSHDHVIFQSSFSRENFEKINNTRVASTVIFNGAYRNAFKKESSNNFLIGCSAKWRVNKRLEGLVESIRLARQISNKDIKLKVIGDPDFSLPSFCFSTGHIDNRMVQKELSECGFFAHICHIESCPNSVVEALLVGLPVICNNIGGTPEIVNKDGLISEIDYWNFKAIDSMSSTKMSGDQIDRLSNDILKLLSMNFTVRRDDLLIDNIAAKYANLFKRMAK